VPRVPRDKLGVLGFRIGAALVRAEIFAPFARSTISHSTTQTDRARRGAPSTRSVRAGTS
jgi:hypothetical protein